MDDERQRKAINKYWNNPVESIEFISRDILSKEAAENAVESILKKYDTQGLSASSPTIPEVTFAALPF